MREPLAVRIRSDELTTEISGWARWDAILWILFLGGGAVTAGILAILHPHDVLRSNDLTIAVGLALDVAASALGIVRGWRMSLRLDDGSLIVRNFFRTHRLGWQEVSGFMDGVVIRLNEGLERQWRLSIALRDGGAIVASATSWSAKTQAALEQAAQSHGIPTELTGVVTSRKSAVSLGSQG